MVPSENTFTSSKDVAACLDMYPVLEVPMLVFTRPDLAAIDTMKNSDAFRPLTKLLATKPRASILSDLGEKLGVILPKISGLILSLEMNT